MLSLSLGRFSQAGIHYVILIAAGLSRRKRRSSRSALSINASNFPKRHRPCSRYARALKPSYFNSKSHSAPSNGRGFAMTGKGRQIVSIQVKRVAKSKTKEGRRRDIGSHSLLLDPLTGGG
jgi:hypothetical protein